MVADGVGVVDSVVAVEMTGVDETPVELELKVTEAVIATADEVESLWPSQSSPELSAPP